MAGYNLTVDLKNGHKNEKVALTFLNKTVYPNDKFKLYKDPFKCVDFKNSEIIGELKSRYNKHDKYRETFFGYNKIEYLLSKKDPKKWVFYFLFTDGLFAWRYREGEYSVRKFDHHEKGIINQVYVNIKYLDKITHTINSGSWPTNDWEEYVN